MTLISSSLMTTPSTKHAYNCTTEAMCICIKIDHFNYKADCSSSLLDLRTFPSFSENVTEVDLKNNSFYKINSTDVLPNGLRWLDMSYCKILEIEEGFLRQFAALEYLDISYNRELTFEVLPNVTYDLQFTSIKVLKLNALHCIYGDGIIVRARHLFHLRNTSLEEIHVSSNRIIMLEQFVLMNLPPTLEKIIAADNRFTFGWYLFEHTYLKRIWRLDISYQFLKRHDPYLGLFEISCDDSKSFRHNDDIRYHAKYRRGLYNTKRASHLTSCLQDYRGKWTATARFTIYICFPQSMKELNFSHSAMETPGIINNTVLDFRGIRKLDFSNNFMTVLKGKVFSSNLTDGDFSNNLLPQIDPSEFALANFSRLDLSKNYMGEQIENGNLRFLVTQSNLLELSLAKNRIYKMPKSTFEGLSNLKYLDLSQNELQKRNFHFDGLDHLEILNLNQNKIKSFTRRQMGMLDRLGHNAAKRNLKFTIDMTENDMSCNCENIDFLRWIDTNNDGHYIHFKNFNDYYCSLSNMSQANFTSLSMILMALDKECSSYTAIIVVSVIVITAGFVSVCVGIFISSTMENTLYVLHGQTWIQRKCACPKQK